MLGTDPIYPQKHGTPLLPLPDSLDRSRVSYPFPWPPASTPAKARAKTSRHHPQTHRAPAEISKTTAGLAGYSVRATPAALFVNHSVPKEAVRHEIKGLAMTKVARASLNIAADTRHRHKQLSLSLYVLLCTHFPPSGT